MNKINKLEEQFNKFIKKWCGNHYPHLIDSDENDGEEFRDLLRNSITQEEIIEKIKRVCLQTGAEITEAHLLIELGVDEKLKGEKD